MIAQRSNRYFRLAYKGAPTGLSNRVSGSLSHANDQDYQEDFHRGRNWTAVLVLGVPFFVIGCLMLAFL